MISETEVGKNVELSIEQIKSLLPRTFHLIINLSSVYFLEYTCITAFAKAMDDHMQINYPNCQDLNVKEFFVIMNSCY